VSVLIPLIADTKRLQFQPVVSKSVAAYPEKGRAGRAVCFFHREVSDGQRDDEAGKG
jgi:hypothetical protein